MYSNYAAPLGVALSAILATSPLGAADPAGKDMPADRAPEDRAAHDLNSLAEPTGTLTLPQALALALTRNPELTAFSQETRAREAATLQAGLLPNPALNISAENLANSRLKGFDGPAVTLQFSQLIELGGKRTRRVRLADLDRDLASWDYEAKRLDVLTDTRKVFMQVLAAQEHLRLAQELLELAGQVQRSTAERVHAGKVSPLEETRAGVATATARLQLTAAQSELQAARVALAALWGTAAPRFERVEGKIEEIVTAIPSPEDIEGLIAQNPDVARWVTEIEQRQAALALARSHRMPDLTVSAGVREYADTGDTALVAGIAVPLPLFDRNQGTIQGSHYRLAKAEDERQAAEARVRSAFARSYLSLTTAQAEVLALRTEVLPAAQRAFEAATEGYRQGKFSYLEVLDAQRTLFDTRGRYLTSLTTYQTAAADLERLVGVALDEIRQGSNPRTPGGRK
jgi:cobalt-zinc-cadmium efflux system outer membrane protein